MSDTRPRDQEQTVPAYAADLLMAAKCVITTQQDPCYDMAMRWKCLDALDKAIEAFEKAMPVAPGGTIREAP